MFSTDGHGSLVSESCSQCAVMISVVLRTLFFNHTGRNAQDKKKVHKVRTSRNWSTAASVGRTDELTEPDGDTDKGARKHFRNSVGCRKTDELSPDV